MISDATQLPYNEEHSFKSDYSENKKLIFIYQIFCKDPAVEENYIGQTECFDNRKYSHSRDSKISDLKIYKVIRNNGGWDNWDMKIMNHYYCSDVYESRQIEQKYIDFFKASMNTVRACSNNIINEELDRELEFELNDYSDRLFGCFLYDFLDFDLDFYNQECICEFCEKQLNTTSSLNYHKKTNKKCLKIQEDNSNHNSNSLKSCEFCKKIFANNNLKIHVKSCKIKKQKIDDEKDNIIENLTNENLFLKNEIFRLETENNIYIKDHEFVKSIASQPKTITTHNNILNNININNFNFNDPEKVKLIIDSNHPIIDHLIHLKPLKTPWVKEVIDDKILFSNSTNNKKIMIKNHKTKN